ncbi:MAG: hypothetical protein J5929_01915 [Eubacterium sp.]|nr:hypothetical protein [Eubacterium sp.]
MDIIRYEVRQEMSDNPMYGKTKLIYSEEECKNMENAIKLAQEYAKAHPQAEVFVWANQYTSENNVKLHRILQSHYIWATWLSNIQCLAKQEYIRRIGE